MNLRLGSGVVRLRIAIAFSCGTIACVIACSSSSPGASDAGIDGAAPTDAAPEGNPFAFDTGNNNTVDANTCLPRRAPKTATSTATVALTGADFGDRDTDGGADSNAWKDIGYNLDGLCTSSLDTNVCQPVDGGARASQQDGIDGVDNAFGHAVVPLVETLQSNLFDTAAVFVDLNGGEGTLFISSKTGQLVVPLTQAVILIGGAGGSGVLSGIVPTAAFEDTFRAFVGRQSAALCSGMQIDGILASLAQASDIGADGTQSSSVMCSGISIGVSFSASQNSSLPSLPVDPCSQ